MEIDPKTCLFIGVDMQPIYAKTEDSRVLDRISTLRGSISASGAPSWQVYMRTPLASRLLPPAARKAEQADINANHALIFPPLLGEKRFGKTDRQPNNAKFDRTLSNLRPAAIFLYGFWLDVCVEATAKYTLELMENIGLKPEVAIIADCGESFWAQGLDGCIVPLITQDELAFPKQPQRRAFTKPAARRTMRSELAR